MGRLPKKYGTPGWETIGAAFQMRWLLSENQQQRQCRHSRHLTSDIDGKVMGKFRLLFSVSAPESKRAQQGNGGVYVDQLLGTDCVGPASRFLHIPFAL